MPKLPPTRVSEATTRSIRVEVMSQHMPEHSQPNLGKWVFQYTVRITNQGTVTAQLLDRHWIITDAAGHIEHVRGPGVIGEQPTLAPGHSHQYSSWCPLPTPTGTMHGTYGMVDEEGNRFEVEIAPFSLEAKYTVH